MATVSRPALLPAGRVELHTGDRMTREEFHRIYQQMPEGFSAELIGGIVYVSSPLKRRHGTNHLPLGTLFFTYQGHTPGVECGDNTTILLGEEGEPQPDLYLRVLPEYGGQSRTTPDDFVLGAPELLAEIAHSGRPIDLHGKKDDYTQYRVWEYLVLCLREHKLRWFDLRSTRELFPDALGIFKIHSFPGLWINGPALVRKDYQPLMDTLQQGLASPQHREFVQQLRKAKKRPRGA